MIAFTATPKKETLQLFGNLNEQVKQLMKEKEKIMCNYCRLLIEGNGTQIVNYANKVGLPYAEKRGDFTMLVHLVKSICEHSLTTGKYKNVATMCMSLFSFVEKYQKHYA